MWHFLLASLQTKKSPYDYEDVKKERKKKIVLKKADVWWHGCNCCCHVTITFSFFWTLVQTDWNGIEISSGWIHRMIFSQWTCEFLLKNLLLLKIYFIYFIDPFWMKNEGFWLIVCSFSIYNILFTVLFKKEKEFNDWFMHIMH